MIHSLPPKTCSIDRMITNQEDVLRVVSGTKRATRRNGRYADIGEEFELQGRRFQITQVYRQSLSDMTADDFEKEGFLSQADYMAHINALHTHMSFSALPNQQVWVHEFSPVEG